VIFLSLFWISFGQDLLSLFGYSQEVQYGKVYHANLDYNGHISNMNLLTFVPGCHNDCPRFFSVYDNFGQIIYFVVSMVESPGVVYNAFAISTTKSKQSPFPPRVITMSFSGNGTAYYVQDNSNFSSNSYSLYSWNAYTNTSTLVNAQNNLQNSIYKACIKGTTVYALDRDHASLITWTGSSFKAVSLSGEKNLPLLVNSLESVACNNLDTSVLVGLDRNGTIWEISSTGSVHAFNSPQWPGVHSINADNQLVIDTRSSIASYVGYDRTFNIYRLVIANINPGTIDISNGGNEIQWIGLTSFPAH